MKITLFRTHRPDDVLAAKGGPVAFLVKLLIRKRFPVAPRFFSDPLAAIQPPNDAVRYSPLTGGIKTPYTGFVWLTEPIFWEELFL
jgi:hypothetical protein